MSEFFTDIWKASGDNKPKIYEEYSGAVEIQDLGSFRYEGIKRDFMPGPESPHSQLEGPITVLKSMEENPSIVWGNTLDEAERRLKSAISIRQRMKQSTDCESQ